MGRLPDYFAGKPISFRIPFTITGELIVLNGTTGLSFPPETFRHNIDKPIEIHRMIIRLDPFDNADPPEILPLPFVGAIVDQQSILEKYIRLKAADDSKNEKIFKFAQLVEGIHPKNTRVWEWEDPYTLVRSEGFSVEVDSILDDYTVTVGNVTLTVGNVRVVVTFEGFLIVIAPASETR